MLLVPAPNLPIPKVFPAVVPSNVREVIAVFLELHRENTDSGIVWNEADSILSVKNETKACKITHNSILCL